VQRLVVEVEIQIEKEDVHYPGKGRWSSKRACETGLVENSSCSCLREGRKDSIFAREWDSEMQMDLDIQWVLPVLIQGCWRMETCMVYGEITSGGWHRRETDQPTLADPPEDRWPRKRPVEEYSSIDS